MPLGLFLVMLCEDWNQIGMGLGWDVFPSFFSLVLDMVFGN